ncbi:tetratricopeptide repeat protein, partial [Streptomyces sp. NPDC058469]|uniref:tetratricopeptide repeat protein n=1 Tax=Streptomyces sp. NPDC058469 TaxID=3346514 RepID=UPI003663D193
MAVDVRRVVEIWNPVGKCSGTGYLVADDIVLTALHNVLGCGFLEVRGLDGDSKWLAAEVLWPLAEPPDLEREPQADGALVRITDPGWVPPAGVEPVRWGRIDGGPVVLDEQRLACVAVGFPRSEVRDGIRDTKEIRGHIERLTGLKSGGLITAYVDGVAVPGKRDEKSSWAGASGAALFARGRLIGVVTTDRRRDYDGDQLTAVSVVGLAARPGFVAAVGELVPEDVTDADREEPSRRAAVYDVEVPPGVNNLPELPSPIFVGRAEVMGELERALSAESQTITQTVHGLGGVGKTTLACHYAHDHAGSYRLVWWIRSDTPELIEAGFAALTARLRGEDAFGLTTAQAAEWAVGWLQTHPGWLLVFDNAEKPGDVHAWTGQLRASGRHLITSRYKRGWVCEPISLHVLDQEASLALLAGLIGGSDEEEDEARALAEELGHLPLALEQAGAFIAQREVPIAAYRAMLEQYPERATAAAPGGFDPARTVARIWRITLDVLEEQDPRAVEILRIAAWYAPTGIPRSLFEPLAEDPVDLAQLLGLLADYSMITLDRTGVGIHRLVQMVARTSSADDPHRDQARILAARERATELMLDELPGDPSGNVEGWPTWRALLPHVEAILDAFEPGEDTVEIDVILTLMGQFLQEQGQLSQATDYLSRSLAAATRLFGEDDPSTLTSRNNLAGAYEASGDVVRAIRLYERVLEDCVRVLGGDHPSTLTSRNNLAGAYEASGDVVRAIRLYERVL